MPAELLYDASSLKGCDLLGIRIKETTWIGKVNTRPLWRRTVPFYTIDIYRDNNRRFRVLVKDEDLNIVPTTDGVGVLTMKETKESTSPSLQLSTSDPSQGMIGAGDEGEMYFFVVPSDTHALDIRQYVFDVQFTDVSNNVYTVCEGVANLLQPVNP